MYTYKFKLSVPKETQCLLWKHANKLNFMYNYFLNQKIQNYQDHKKDPSVKLISKFDQIKEIKILKDNESVELKTDNSTNKITLLNEIHSQVLQTVPDRLDKAYKSFFNRVKNKSTPGFPKFRSCKNFFGILYPQSGYKIKDNKFITKIYKELSFNKNNREILGDIKQVYISCKNNKFYISIVTDYSYNISTRNSNILAIDLGLKFLVKGRDNKGKIISYENKGHAKHYSKKISKLQSVKDKLPVQTVEGRFKPSRKYKKISQKIQRLYEMKVRKITDFHHKLSHELSHQYDTIVVEDLSIKKMSESDLTSLNRNMREAKLAQFLRFLEYKTYKLVKVNPYNTSKTCNKCGYIHKNLKLSDRQIKCINCGHEYDRDENAAENIYCLGQAILDSPNQESVTDITLKNVLSVRNLSL